VEQLAHLIAKDSKGPLKACCILKGAHVFFAHLTENLKKLKTSDGESSAFQSLMITTLQIEIRLISHERQKIVPMSFEFIKVKSYENDHSTGQIRISMSEEDLLSLKGKDLLIVEDIIDTGATMSTLIDMLKRYEPARIRVVSLLLKRTQRNHHYIPDYVGFSIPDLFVVGYCLDYNEVFRDLDHIAVISEIGKIKYAV
jgi:hypoxanthine phosphoribosyltransferase